MYFITNYYAYNFRLELVFTEERKRASDRIIAMTRQHELNIKELVLKMNAQM